MGKYDRMSKEVKYKAWLYETTVFLNHVKRNSKYREILRQIVSIIGTKFLFPIVITKDEARDNNIKVNADIKDDKYVIEIDDSEGNKEEFSVNCDGENANYTSFLPDETIYRYYRINSWIADISLKEKVSKQKASMKDSQIALFKDLYDILDITSDGFEKVINPKDENCQKGCYPDKYYCNDIRNKKLLAYSNRRGKFVIGLRLKDLESIITISIIDGKAYIVFFAKKKKTTDGVEYTTIYTGDRISYEECVLSEEIKDTLKKIVKALIDNNVDASELPTELTDQTQYS